MVTVFAETNSNPSKPTLPGLFTWSGGTIPASGTAVTGLAGSITVNSKLITSQGGDPTLLRDGGINNSATETGYTKNTSGGSGYSTQLDAFITAMNAKMAFDPTAGSSTNASLMDYSASSIGWLEGQRSTATTAAENTSAALSRSSGAYSNATGVSLDEELTLMMDIEQSYKAGTKILNTVNQMLQAVLDLAS